MKDAKTIVLWETPWCPSTNGKQKKYKKKPPQIKQQIIKGTITTYEWKKAKKKNKLKERECF